MNVGTTYLEMVFKRREISVVEIEEVPIRMVRRIEHMAYQITSFLQELVPLPPCFHRNSRKWTHSRVPKRLTISVGVFEIWWRKIAIRDLMSPRQLTSIARRNKCAERVLRDDRCFAQLA